MTVNLFLFILFALSLLMNTIGFRHIVHFVNVGYAFSITIMSAAALLIFPTQIHFFTLLQMSGLIIWGLRLGIFVMRRENKPSYQKELQHVEAQYGGLNLAAKVGIWIMVSVLYVLMFLPALFNLTRSPFPGSLAATALQWSGLIILFGGLSMEIIADRQKSIFKKRFPNQFCDVGLYRWVRCPNYLGEILIWTGSWMMSIPAYSLLWQWLTSLIGLVCIVLIMMGSTKRLEFTQDQRYGSLPEYQIYIQSIPVLFPFVPIYTLKHIRVYLE